MGRIWLVADERYLDVSPTALLIGAAILVGLFVLTLLAQKAVRLFRDRR